MTSRPILFSGPMVRALLAGTKTQTRRVIKVQPPDDSYKIWTCLSTTGNRKNENKQHWVKTKNEIEIVDEFGPYFSCPYGQPGDRLWVRETFLHELAGSTDQTGEWVDWWCDKGCVIEFLADVAKERHLQPSVINSTYMKKRPSIFMPRWASRITLEITDVRVQRLQEISEEDAGAEGSPEFRKPGVPLMGMMVNKLWYRGLWDSINAARGYGWDSNPWVWAVSFKRVV